MCTFQQQKWEKIFPKLQSVCKFESYVEKKGICLSNCPQFCFIVYRILQTRRKGRSAAFPARSGSPYIFWVFLEGLKLKKYRNSITLIHYIALGFLLPGGRQTPGAGLTPLQNLFSRYPGHPHEVWGQSTEGAERS